MAFTEIVVQGTLNADGTLQLDERPNLTPGRVTVVLRQEDGPEVPQDDPFWQRMQTIWDRQKAAGIVPRSVEQIEAERRQEREGWANRQRALEEAQGGNPADGQPPAETEG
jgi:hypothetical protein